LVLDSLPGGYLSFDVSYQNIMSTFRIILVVATYLTACHFSISAESESKILETIGPKIEVIRVEQKKILEDIDNYFKSNSKHATSGKSSGVIRLACIEELKLLRKRKGTLFASSKESNEKVKAANAQRAASADRLQTLIADDDLEGMKPFATENLQRAKRALVNKAYKLLVNYGKKTLTESEVRQLEKLQKRYTEIYGQLQTFQ
jgi:hypothetical protein